METSVNLKGHPSKQILLNTHAKNQAKLKNHFLKKYKKSILVHFNEFGANQLFVKKIRLRNFLNYDHLPLCGNTGKTNEQFSTKI